MSDPASPHAPLDAVCIGAGPAGLTAAYLLTKSGKSCAVLEMDENYVGGIARTATYKGFGIDIGGHRFFSKSTEVNALWREILGENFLERPRKSRIFYGKKFYPYPLEVGPTLQNLGIFTALACVLSYVKARAFPVKNPKNFEDWVINHFGERLYLTFFKTYTEKVWGMNCRDISADWAAQRIKGLSLSTAVINALFKGRNAKKGSATIKTLINSFYYPRRGPGMMWEHAAEKIKKQGGSIEMGAAVTGLSYDAGSALWSLKYTQGGKEHALQTREVISSAPLRELVRMCEPLSRLPQVQDAASKLNYRDFLIVGLIVKDRGRFDDNWIYVHEPEVKVGRIQNFKSWSPDMVPDASLNCYGMEYFCFEGDGLWSSTDPQLIALATKELASLGLTEAGDVKDGVVIRQPKAYPVYDDVYAEAVAVIRDALVAHCPGLFVTGRAGMHKYNNQDHAMMTAMLTVQNMLEKTNYDVWNVNQDAEYIEEGTEDSGGRLTPHTVS